MGRRVLKFDGLSGRGLWYRPQGDEYKVSVTGLAFLCHRGSGKRIADSRAARSYGMMGVLLSYLPASAGQTKCRLLSI